MKDAEALRLVARIRADLAAAMKSQNQIEVSVLKSLLASFSDAEAVAVTRKSTDAEGIIAEASGGLGSTEAPRKELGMPDLARIIRAEIEELQQAIVRLDESNNYRSELETKKKVLEKYEK